MYLYWREIPIIINVTIIIYISYGEIVKIAKIPRGIGLWGDLVVTLRDKSRLEMRAVPSIREIYDYMAEKVADKTGKPVEAITAQ